jgi:hypothetical protein
MGVYAVANNVSEDTALGTSGAGPCQIIVVHKKKGIGALGHFAGHTNPQKIVQGVTRMIAQLGGGPIEHIVFAAGQTDGSEREQLNYEIGIVGTLRSRAYRVDWPKAPHRDVWGYCYYLPLEEKVGLLQHYPGVFPGEGSPEHGITAHSFFS